MSDSLTLEDMQKAIDLIYPPLYYALDKYIDRGTCFLCKETDFNPEFIVCHPEDFDKVKSMITARRLKPITEEPKIESWSRLRKVLEKRLIELTNENFKP